jgi:drug/metabolite transporter (DMT)-like permease
MQFFYDYTYSPKPPILYHIFYGTFVLIMPPFAILLLLSGAILHTTWNLLLKKAGDKYIASWWMVTTGGMIALFILLFTGLPAPQMWKFAIFSIAAEAVYYITLSYAYHDNEFSLIYPIARGAAPAFLALWSFLFLKEQPTSGGLIGLGFIIAGLLIIGISTLAKSRPTRLHFKGVAVAIFLALLISIYSAIDGAAVKNGYATAYVMTMFALVPLPITPFIVRQYGWPRLWKEWKQQPFRLPLTGALGISAYLLAVWAYSIAPLSYAGAIREVSVVFGALAGWLFLKEKMGITRVLGAAVIFVGILVIATFG